MMTTDSTPFQAPRHSSRRTRALGPDDHCPDRVVVGPPIGDGRVAFVQQLDAPAAQTAAGEVLISVFGRRPRGDGVERLLQAAVRRCDLWNGDFDAGLEVLVRWTCWVVTRIERRDLATQSA